MVKEGKLPVFKKRLNELLEGRSITDFAKSLEISRQTLGFYLNGDRIPDIKHLKQICEYCGVSSDWLIGLSDVKSPNATIQAIHASTGLSEKAIDNIKQVATGEKRNTLNAVLQSAQLEKLVNAIWCSAFYANQRGDIITAYMVDKLEGDNSAPLAALLEPIVRGGGDPDILFKYSASEAASALFDEVSSEIYDEMHPERR